MSDPLLIVVVIVILLLGNGFFSGSEIAIISSRRSRIERMAEAGNRAAQRVRELQDHMDRFLATVQIGVTVFGTLAGVLGGVLASRYLEPQLAGGTLDVKLIRFQKVREGFGVFGKFDVVEFLLQKHTSRFQYIPVIINYE